jgi:hypothetical protein
MMAGAWRDVIAAGGCKYLVKSILRNLPLRKRPMRAARVRDWSGNPFCRHPERSAAQMKGGKKIGAKSPTPAAWRSTLQFERRNV